MAYLHTFTMEQEGCNLQSGIFRENWINYDGLSAASGAIRFGLLYKHTSCVGEIIIIGWALHTIIQYFIGTETWPNYIIDISFNNY